MTGPGRGGAPPVVAFTYAPGRSGSYAKAILEGFTGTLQVDGYAGYNQLLRQASMGSRQGIALAYCWAHARRKLFEVSKSGITPMADEGLGFITKLYGIEKELRGQSAQERQLARQHRSLPVINALKAWLDQTRARVSAKSPLGEACKYMAKLWEGLCLFLDDGRIELDNNTVERTIRPIALNRKNALFAGHDEGAQNWAIIASLIETCKLNAINPFDYLSQTLRAIVQSNQPTDLKSHMPWNLILG